MVFKAQPLEKSARGHKKFLEIEKDSSFSENKARFFDRLGVFYANLSPVTLRPGMK
jgi:hypothetical protein